MDKLQMAHEYAMQRMINPKYKDADDLDVIYWAWEYVGAMQAEADKRKEKSLSDAASGCVTIYNIPENSIIFSIDNVFPQEEWQPDWSQAPSWVE